MREQGTISETVLIMEKEKKKTEFLKAFKIPMLDFFIVGGDELRRKQQEAEKKRKSGRIWARCYSKMLEENLMLRTKLKRWEG